MTALELFTFEGHETRVVMLDGQPWWVAADLARALGYRDAANAIRLLRPRQYRYSKLSTLGGEQRMVVVSESGLNRLVMRSSRPEAERFQDWIEETVIPAIHRTGGYSTDAPAIPSHSDAVDARELAEAQVEQLQAVAKVNDPQARAWVDLASADGDYSVSDAAKLLARGGVPMKPRQLFVKLLELGMIFTRGRGRRMTYHPYQRHVTAGRLVMRLGGSYKHPETAVDLDLGNRELLARAAELLGGLGLSSRLDGLACPDDGKPTGAACSDLADELREASKADPILPPWARGFVVFLTDLCSETDRVLKPGGFVCAWALPKTADLAAMAMRAVGWTLWESVLHLFGGGMNKAGCIGKKIDAAAGAVREVTGEYARGGMTSGLSAQRVAAGYRPNLTVSDGLERDKPATDAAKRWTGWHSQIAPGHEQWLIARKPKTRGMTDAQQLEAHGCGAFNVGATRVPRDSRPNRLTAEAGLSNAVQFSSGRSGLADGTTNEGSHPRNVILSRGGDGCPVEGLDRQSGVTPISARSTRRPTGAAVGCYGDFAGGEVGDGHAGFDDVGGASRFFTQFDQRVHYGGKVKTRKVPGRSDIHNDHNTPKNLELMRWLVRLMAATAEHTGDIPAIVLDHTMGSGTTGVACVAEGVRFIGIEQDPQPGVEGSPQSFHIARARILAAIGSPEAAAEANERAPVGGQLGLL